MTGKRSIFLLASCLLVAVIVVFAVLLRFPVQDDVPRTSGSATGSSANRALPMHRDNSRVRPPRSGTPSFSPNRRDADRNHSQDTPEPAAVHRQASDALSNPASGESSAAITEPSEEDPTTCCLTGNVVDSSQAPVSGATVASAVVVSLQAELPGVVLGQKPNATTTTDKEGKYRLSGLPPGTVRVTAGKEGFIGETTNVTLVEGKTVSLDFTLRQVSGESISGIVVDVANEPVAGALVKGSWREPNSIFDSSVSTHTDETGEFKLKGLPEIHCRISAKAKGFSEKLVSDISPGSTGVVIRLNERTGSISGTVKFSGEPPPTYEVSVIPTGGEGSNLKKLFLHSKEDGNFALPEVEAGTYTILAKAGGYAAAQAENVFVEGGKETTGVVIEMTTGGSVSGKVTRQGADTTVSGVDVIVVSEASGAQLVKRATTNAEGKFEIANLATGKYAVWCQKGNLSTKKSPKNIFVASSKTQCDLQLPVGGVLGGTVTMGEDKDAAELVVSVVSLEGGNPVKGRVDKEGAYRIADLKPGKCNAALENPKEDGKILKIKTVTVVAGKTTQADFSLTGTVTFKGKVFLNNEVWANTFFSLEKDGEGMLIQVDKNGLFEKTGVVPGKYTCFFTVMVAGKPEILKEEIEILDALESYQEFSLRK